MLHAKPIRPRLVALESEGTPLFAAGVLAPVLEMHRRGGMGCRGKRGASMATAKTAGPDGRPLRISSR